MSSPQFSRLKFRGESNHVSGQSSYVVLADQRLRVPTRLDRLATSGQLRALASQFESAEKVLLEDWTSSDGAGDTY